VRGPFFSSECHVDQLGSISFILQLLNQFWIVARSVCIFCEAMAISLVSTGVSSAKVVVNSGDCRSAVYSRYNKRPRTLA
jgi:hypothetical protein